MLTQMGPNASRYRSYHRGNPHGLCHHRGIVNRATVIRVGALSLVAMVNGTVDFFNNTGGYGFIDTEDSDEDVFFHMEDVGGADLEEDTEVEFDIEQSQKGPRASNLTRQ